MDLAHYSIPVLLLPPIPKDMSDNLIEWFGKSQPVFSSLKEIMLSAFVERVKRLNEMPKRAHDIFWWPFTQHEFVPEEKITVIDSRCGENFSVYKVCEFLLCLWKLCLLALLSSLVFRFSQVILILP